MSHCTVYAITNQKGGVGKTTTTVNLGIGLAKAGKRVLLIDFDPQASLTASLGYKQPDELDDTISTVLEHSISDKPMAKDYAILHHDEGVDFIPSNIELSELEVRLINTMSREQALREYLDSVKENYDYILIDCMPSLGVITINALVAADRVIIPTQPNYLSAKAFATVEPNTEAFVNKLYEGIEEVEKRGVDEDRNSHAIPQQGTDVFISYSRGDSRIVGELCEIFKEKGLNVWYDRINLHKGTDFMRQIENAIRHSRFFVPVLTQTIIDQAKEEHTYRLEWEYAIRHIRHIGGISYCAPFYEKDFDMDDILADIPNDLKRHDVFPFSQETFRQDAEKMASYIINEIQRR